MKFGWVVLLSIIKMLNIFKNKTIAVTGGLGSIGSEIIRKLLKHNPKQIILIDNRETETFYSQLEFPKVVHKIADIRDYKLIDSLFKEVDIVFHAAAMKHVTLCEEFPFEALKTNVLGTKNIIDACIKNNVGKMILISTDKAANPLSMMGSTKLLAEKMVSAVATIKKCKTQFGIIRFGNVLYSRGSVLEIWEGQLKEKKNIFVTNKDMTRFFMSLDQAVDLIFTATKHSKKGEIFILKMPSVNIGEFAKAFLKSKGLPENRIKIIGSKPGEKLHEKLLTESDNLVLESKDLFISFPPYTDKKVINEIKKKGFKKSKVETISSNDKALLLNEKDILKYLLKHK